MNFDIFDEDEFDADIEDHVPEVNPEDLIIQK